MALAEDFEALERAVAAKRMAAAQSAVGHLLLEPLKPHEFRKLDALLEAQGAAWRECTGGRELHWAILGGYTTDPIRQIVRPLTLSAGYWPEIYEGHYDSARTETLDSAGPLFRFRPDLVLLATGTLNLEGFPAVGESVERVERRVEEAIETLRRRWQAIAAGCGARVIQHNFEPPPSASSAGRLEGRYAWTPSRFVERLNARLWEHDGREVRILNVHQLAGIYGRDRWAEPRWFFHSKHGFDPALTFQYARALGGLFRALIGKAKKCLVTDLDNTLWGGVVGDDGMEGIALGTISPEGEAYAAFGRYLKLLQQSGITLAVNSKNDPELAVEVFDRHPETPLRREDFAAFVCNWGSKAANLQEIARQLNIGVDSLVFVDDSAAECGEIRRELPEVTVVNLTGDPAHFPRQLEALHLFDQLDLTEEDLARAQSYRASQELAAVSASPVSLSAYLGELAMVAEISPSRPEDFPRLEQLFRKTNQFNLTSRQYDQAALRAFMEAADAFCLSCWLKDRLASHGLVSAVVGFTRGESLIIDNWVMSCRVFTRTFEECIFAELLRLARERGCVWIEGEFVPTSRNGYVRELYERLGFRCVADSSPARYVLEVEGARLPETCVRLAGETAGLESPRGGLA